MEKIKNKIRITFQQNKEKKEIIIVWTKWSEMNVCVRVMCIE